MVRDFIKEIPELNQPNVHIKNKEHVNKVISELIIGEFNRLQVVSDFDMTITKQHENGKLHLSSFRMFTSCPSIPEEYKAASTGLWQKYFPIEFNANIPIEEKKQHMEEWYKQSEKILCGLKVSQSELDEVVASLGPSLRDGSKSLFELLSIKNVPILVFSAGLGDSVVSVLNHCNVFYNNIKVISNFLKRDEDGTILGFKGKLIHVANKNEIALKGTEYYDLILNRDNIIVLGDSLGDAAMADGISHSNHILKIGFLYQNIEENLPLYKDTFDIVLEDDQTMNVITAIIGLLNN